MIKPANGVAEQTEHEGNTETSVTAGISISLMDTGSASLPIKYKGTERLQALEVSLVTTDQPPGVCFICELFLTSSEEIYTDMYCIPKGRLPTELKAHLSAIIGHVLKLLKLDLLFAMTV